MQTRTYRYGTTEDAYSWKDRIRQKLEMQGKTDKIKRPKTTASELTLLHKYSQRILGKELMELHKRLQRAFLLDKAQYPNTYSEQDIVNSISINGDKSFCGVVRSRSWCLLWEFEKAQLLEIKGPNGFVSTQYLAFE